MGMHFYFSNKTDFGWEIPYSTKVTSAFTFKDENDYEGTPNPSYIRELDLSFANDSAAELLALFDIEVKHGVAKDTEVTDELIEKAGQLFAEYHYKDVMLSKRIKRFRDFLQYGKDHGYKNFYGM